MNNNRILISIGILLVVICLCLTAIAAVAGGVYFLGNRQIGSLFASPTPTPSPITPTTAPPATVAIPTPFETPTPLPDSVDRLPENVARQMDTIQRQVADIRGLELPDNVKRSLLTVDQLRDKVENDFLADYTQDEVEDDVRVLASLGLLEPGFDLYDLYLELYTEQIAGFYDIDTDDMYVVLEEGFTGPQRSTYAHEFTHALQDSAHNVRENLNYSEEYCETDSEYCAAIQALIEGDATLTEQSWLFLYATDRDRKEIEDYYQTIDLSVFDNAPAFLQEDFMFPYSKGVDFVLTLFEEGRFERIDQAFQDPPVSTEQILHPERYPEDQPLVVEIPDLSELLGRPMRGLDRGVMGEWYTYLILARGEQESTRLGDEQAAEAAEGWGGDAYAIYWDEQTQKTVTTLSTIWDSEEEAAQFADAFIEFGRLRWGEATLSTAAEISWESDVDGAVIFSHTGSQTVWMMAPKMTDAQLILDALVAGVR